MKYSELKTKKAKVEFIREKLSTDLNWAIKGLVSVYALQTDDEQSSGYTKVNNGVGFSGVDSEILSSFAKQTIRGNVLSPKQKTILFKSMPKYAKQLMMVADQQETKKQAAFNSAMEVVE